MASRLPRAATMRKDEYARYLPLHRDICRGDWEEAEWVYQRDREAVRAPITRSGDTSLLVAIISGQSPQFIAKLLKLLTPEDLGWQNRYGNSALHEAAVVGDLSIARLILQKNTSVLILHNGEDYLPLHIAARHGHRTLVNYFLDAAQEARLRWWNGGDRVLLMQILLTACLFDVALDLLRKYQHLASLRGRSAIPEAGLLDASPLEIIAEEPFAFPSGTELNMWELFLYKCCVVDPDSESPVSGIQKVLDTIVPRMKYIRETKFVHYFVGHFVFDLLDYLEGNAESSTIVEKSFLLAIKHGIVEMVQLILDEHPSAIDAQDEKGRLALHLAVMYRRENVFSILIQQGGVLARKQLSATDSEGNNILHLVGRMPYQPQLKPASGAVLQMQRELQWYTEMEKLVPLQARTAPNLNGKTPIMVFDEEHRSVIKSEEKWILSLAGASIVATTIIGTIAFGAAIQVPGGNNSEGQPLFYEETAFKIFSTSNAVAFCSAISTFLIFLSIFTARYAAIDFLYTLPRKLIIGQLFLFISVMSTIIAFNSAMYLMSRPFKILSPVALITLIFSLISFLLFASFQFPIFLNMVKTTYGKSIIRPIDQKRDWK